MENIVLPDVSRLTFNSGKHAYTLDGTKLLSGVTTVLSATSDKAQLINWSANMSADYVRDNEQAFVEADVFLPEKFRQIVDESRTAHTRKKEAAGSLGTDVHALVEEYVLACIESATGRPQEAIPRLIGVDPILPFIEWASQEVGYFVAAEQKLYDEENAVAGTADFFYVSKVGEFVAGDLKTFPKMWSPDAYCQTGMYARMWRMLTGLQATKSVVVKMCDPNDIRLKKYGGKAFAVYERFALQEDEDMFLKRLAVYRYNQNFKSPKE